MDILVFGNPLAKEDSLPLRLLPKLKKSFPDVDFKEFDTVEDLQTQGKDLIIIDTVEDIEKVELIDMSSIKLERTCSLHDFDLGYNLRLLKKLGQINSAKIIAVPVRAPEETVLEQIKAQIQLIPKK